ncbi:hypothetical protein [Leisingera aquaemixtae]|uniref:hypothetical protein n=1 Tax=Leisingera aquaemixtae TaxID=1396826 RepID=UPI0021BDB06D|nr:hypothetical protein [Leisingera aquaemixtae]
MKMPELKTGRFNPEDGFRITVQVPETRAQRIVDAVLAVTALKYGDYDRVTFQAAAGKQSFRSLGSGRNRATEAAVQVPCVELSFFLARDDAGAARVLESIYAAHPYEEPVIYVAPCMRTLHIRGLDEDNPNRFWNSPSEDWVPEEHR